MQRKTKYITLTLISLCLLSYFFASQYGYSFDENQALRKSYPFQNGNVVYQQDFGNNKVEVKNSDIEE